MRKLNYYILNLISLLGSLRVLFSNLFILLMHILFWFVQGSNANKNTRKNTARPYTYIRNKGVYFYIYLSMYCIYTYIFKFIVVRPIYLCSNIASNIGIRICERTPLVVYRNIYQYLLLACVEDETHHMQNIYYAHNARTYIHEASSLYINAYTYAIRTIYTIQTYSTDFLHTEKKRFVDLRVSSVCVRDVRAVVMCVYGTYELYNNKVRMSVRDMCICKPHIYICTKVLSAYARTA